MAKKKSEDAVTGTVEINSELDKGTEKETHFVFPAGFKTGIGRASGEITGGLYIKKGVTVPDKIILHLLTK